MLNDLKKSVLEGYYPKHCQQFTCPGDRFQIEYVKKFDDNGASYLEEVGKKDLQALYDSYRDSCDLSLIIKQMQLDGVDVHSAFASSVDTDAEPEDFVQIQRSTLGERLQAAQNYESNKKLLEEYEAKLQALEAENQKLKEVHDNE